MCESDVQKFHVKNELHEWNTKEESDLRSPSVNSSRALYYRINMRNINE